MNNRWDLCEKAIEWHPLRDHSYPHEDHLEMSGKELSLILNYGVSEQGRLILEHRAVVPMLRTIPNNTGGSFQAHLQNEDLPVLRLNGKEAEEYPELFRFDGVMTIESRTFLPGLRILREIYPSDNDPMFFHRITLIHHGTTPVAVSISPGRLLQTGRGANGVFLVESRISPETEERLLPGSRLIRSVQFSIRPANRKASFRSPEAELLRRRARVAELTAPLQLKTGIPELDLEFHFSKLRAGESIFRTRSGLLHSPGGGTYYAAVWCNDQLEYAAPWFGWTGDPVAGEATRNAFHLYTSFMGPDGHFIPSSIIAEGFDIWEGRGDRGDAAMFAYGATRFALLSGERKNALDLWESICWALEYCHRRRNRDGVVRSDTDEMENRLPAGDANLSTSTLYYGALAGASAIAGALGMTDRERLFRQRASRLAKAIERYFGSEIHGFRTYRYYDDCRKLRAWIGLPLCMGIRNRAAETVRALYSPRLRFQDGLLSQEGDKVYWDRSTLTAFRGTLAAGFPEETFPLLLDYVNRRLRGDHVPYPIEAWPEGNRRHLSAESALFCRIIPEGLLGMAPLSFDSFSLAPALPNQIQDLELNDIRAFGTSFDLHLSPKGVTVHHDGKDRNFSPRGGIVTLHETKGHSTIHP